MKPVSQWSCSRCRPAVHGDDSIYITQVVPQEQSLTLAWTPEEKAVSTVFCRKKGSGEVWQETHVSGSRANLEGLNSGTDYEFYIRCGDRYSAVGYARPGYVPGTVVNYLHPEDPKYAFSGQHPCSPCLCRHSDGHLLVSMDVFDGAAPQNLTLIFRSDDNGKSWYHYSELFPCFWGTLFCHRGDVYMLSVSTEYGDVLIGRSEDGGKNFGTPTVLLRGSCHRTVPGWHKSTMPVLLHGGRLWCGLDFGSHLSGGHASCLLSADAEGDLLDARNWCVTDPLVYCPEWEGAVKGDTRGFLEGNAVALPDGSIGNFLRYSTDRGEPRFGLAPILRGSIQAPEKKLTLDRFVSFPGNLSKFDVRLDEADRHYYAIVSRITDSQRPTARNVLSLLRSPDLEHWETAADLLDYRDFDAQYVGFQYVSFLFDGDDILFVSRTAFNGAQSYHDNNYVTFHRIRKFRSSAPELSDF